MRLTRVVALLTGVSLAASADSAQQCLTQQQGAQIIAELQRISGILQEQASNAPIISARSANAFVIGKTTPKGNA